MNSLAHNVTDTHDATPIAIVQGQVLTVLPKDLYIPPDAMEVFLEAFEGPLDLLLYLIKKQNLDILNIPIAEVTRQYMEYVELMKSISLELAAEYLVMAALLAEIKSRMLLVQPGNPDTLEEDPRAELVRRLQEYERFKNAALQLDEIPRQGRDTFSVCVSSEALTIEKPKPVVSLTELLAAFVEVLKRAELSAHHTIEKETFSVRERMGQILATLKDREFITFSSLFTPDEGRLGVVVTFLAMLELLKEAFIEFIQAAPFGPIHLKLKGTA